MSKVLRRTICGILTIALVLALVPNLGKVKSVEAAGINTAMIDSVCKKYNYYAGYYWTYGPYDGTTYSTSSPKRNRGYVATKSKGTPAGAAGNYNGYVYNGFEECYGFACFLMSQVTGTDVNPNKGNVNGWKKYGSSSVSSLKVGDIVRASGHSAVVYKDNGNGTYEFIEVWGGVNNDIKYGKFTPGNAYNTLQQIKNIGLDYVYRYEGNIISNNRPIGCIDKVESREKGKIWIGGWAFDPDTSGSIDVHVYIGAPAGQTLDNRLIKADTSGRPDVNQAFGISGNHGIDTTISTDKTGTITLYFYAINDDHGTDNPLIGTKQVTMSSHVHDYKFSRYKKQTTCTKSGIEVWECSCGASLTKDVDAYGHKFTNYVKTISEPTCTEAGVDLYKCWCGETKEVTRNALGHNEVTDSPIEATESTNGMTEGKHCAVCGEITQKPEVLPMIGKTDVEVGDGTVTGKLDDHEYIVCNGEYTASEALSKQNSEYHLATITSLNEHNFIQGLINKMDTKSEGYWLGASDEDDEGNFKWYTGELFTYNRWPVGQPDNKDSTDGSPENYLGIWWYGIWNDFSEKYKLGYILEKDEFSSCEHNWDEGEITTEPNCTEEGIKTYTCTKCGEIKTETIPAKGHVQEIIPRVEPTCTECGYEEGVKCSECNEILEEPQVIDALDHNYKENVVREASCYDSGLKLYMCTRCNDYYIEDDPKKEHNEVYYEGIEPTCDSAGVTQGSYCSECGMIIKRQEIISALGHDWDNGVIIKDSTCQEEGEILYTCSRCNDSYSDIIEKKDHVIVIDPEVPATTTSTGLTEGSHCSVCNAVIKAQQIIPKKEDQNKKKEEETKRKAEEEAKKKTETEAKQKAEEEAKKKAEAEAKQKAEEEAKKKAEEEANKKAEEPEKTNYSNEWVNGKYYDINGQQTYEGTLAWCINGTGKWVEDTNGWYPVNEWVKIDGVWYYFKSNGYAAENEYYFGYWFNFDGTWNDQYFLTWKCNSVGWWVEDISGWWPSSSWLKVDGCWYYFNSNGYMVTNRYIDGYWIGADGVCR